MTAPDMDPARNKECVGVMAGTRLEMSLLSLLSTAGVLELCSLILLAVGGSRLKGVNYIQKISVILQIDGG